MILAPIRSASPALERTDTTIGELSILAFRADERAARTRGTLARY